MRLVGASNFYIQLPFLLEAAVAAALGAVVAVVGLVAVKTLVIDGVLAPSFQFTAFVGWDAVLAIAPILLMLGVALASLAAFFTLRKFLRV
jgi:cell division transport system permease protein